MRRFILALAGLSLLFSTHDSAYGSDNRAQSAQDETHRSDLISVRGVKFPNSAREGRAPVVVNAFSVQANAALGGFSELVPYTLTAPDQDEAGSCLYMSLTGIAEWWLARMNPQVSRALDGPLDLSERYLMNLSGDGIVAMDDWKTDSVYLFNKARAIPRNVDYRFTKGWSVIGTDGDRVHATKNTSGAIFGTEYNWIDHRKKLDRASFVELPKFRREILFADPDSNQWNTGVMPNNIAETIKRALREKKAPVQVIYNHFGYWHANFIVGYDDAADTHDCKFVRDFLSYLSKNASDLRAKATDSGDKDERAGFVEQASRDEETYRKTKSKFDEGGGCHSKGIFYVRDSIYPDQGGPIYDYDPRTKGEEAPYSKRLVLLEYDWVRTMGNHAIVITAE